MSDHAPTTAKERTELQGLCDAATPAPWEVGEHGGWHCLIEIGYDAVPLTLEDYQFAALARNAMPRLLQEVKRLDALAAQLVGEELLNQEGNYETEMQRLYKQVEAGREAIKAIEDIERGCSHPEDGVQRAILTRTRRVLDVCREAGLLEGGKP